MPRLAAALRKHRRVGLETTVFIYHLEGAARFSAPAGATFGELAGGAFAGVTSSLTLMELVVKPLQVAACLQHGATAFLTNDRDLRRIGSAVEVLLLADFVDE